MSSITAITNIGGSEVPIEQLNLPIDLYRSGLLFSQTGQYIVSNESQRILILQPFSISGGPLYFDYLLFKSTDNTKFNFFNSVSNTNQQGSSAHQYIVADGKQSVLVSDSGKEWIGSRIENLYSQLGYDHLKEPPQDYFKYPLGFVFKIEANENSLAGISKSTVTKFRAFNENTAYGDFNGDGITDYAVSGRSTIDVDTLFWSRIGYLELSMPSGLHQTIWVNSPNLEQSGVAKFGMSNVSAVDLDSDGKDEIIYSGSASNIDVRDKVVAIYKLQGNQLIEAGHVNGYGKFLSNPSYKQYLIDYNKDGRQDLLIYFGVGSVGFEVLENLGSGIFKPVDGNLGLDNLSLPDFKSLQIVDVNNDGYLDIVLDNLTPDWNLNKSIDNLSQAFLINKNGTQFVYSGVDVKNLSGLALEGRIIATSFVGEVERNVFQFVTSFSSDDYSKLGTFTQNVSFSSPINSVIVDARYGNDTLAGGDKVDVAIYSGKSNDYQISRQNLDYVATLDLIPSRDGSDTLTSIERLQFSDINIALDVAPTQNAGSVYMLYKAAFNRAPDAGGMGYWIAQKDGGANIVTSIAQGFVNSDEFISKYGANPTNASYVNNLYQNVLGRTGEAGGVEYWTGEMDAGRVSKAEALVQFATLPEGASLVAPLIANGIPYQEWVGNSPY